MTSDFQDRELIVGMTPFGEPNAALATAVSRAGCLGVLDLGRHAGQARAALAQTRDWTRGPFGVRVAGGCPLHPGDLPDEVDTVVMAHGTPWAPASVGPRRVLGEVTSRREARAAITAGVHGLIARGTEAGGRVGELSTFVLLQQLLADPEVDVPVWAAGGIGVHTAPAAVAGGARGVVLDSQLALVAEAGLPADVAAAIRAMDGSETTIIARHRVYARPDLPIAELGSGGPAEVACRLGARGLRSQLLPIGQDGGFAEPLARRYKTAGGVVQAIRAAIADHITTAVELEPLAPRTGSTTWRVDAADVGDGVRTGPMTSRSHRRLDPAGGVVGDGLRTGSVTSRSRRGTDAADGVVREHEMEFPVAQGPMTRVSDQAAFAAAVADGGGLPFLALALMSGPDVALLLTETRELLGDRPWGVGILGFTPPEVRAAQLEVVHEIRPPYALIAGGRPSQAAPLEEAGISTYLHVPSPGLLDRFLKDGARKFVFEGSECGGHVGPRASFPLWETQISRLLEAPCAELSVLFAGGIHDERSAAMVAAMAAPLHERGATVGVLMGTAYLFTEEAVAAGAILPGFQRAALDCADTVLLETSPGHATRCARTPYVDVFDATKRGLIDGGSSIQDTWAELERLNLGRLRIASKGLTRDGDALVPVEEAEQHRDGMYMIGQVATMRSSVTTVRSLHEQVTAGAGRRLAARAAELFGGAQAAAAPAGLDIAIVGMAGVFPRAADLSEYWANIVSGVDAVTEVAPDRWNPAVYYAADGGPGLTPSKWGGFVPPVPFDALSYGIPPTSLTSIEPAQLLALEVAARALADAGYADRPFDRSRTSVIFGAEAGTDLGGAYGFRSLLPTYFGEVPAALDEHLPRLTEDSFPGVLTNVIAGRIANRLDLGGVNYTVDAACASSLAALDLACKELVTGGSDLVLCGAADLHNGVHDYLMFASVHALSPTGRCATFDSAADGIALGEGVACVALKRLADAERDGDRVYAVIKGVGGSSDGRSLGLTAPLMDGQRRALERAYANAGVSPAAVGMIEAHGTGTVVGDRTELAALTELFADAGADRGATVLGSVKSQIGHTKCTAGLAGVIKAATALHTGVRPGTLHLRAPNPYWDADASPFSFGGSARPWAMAPAERFAGVSAFGFGGTNFHVVLGGYDGAPEPRHGLTEWPAELFVFRGADRAAALAEMDRLASLMSSNDEAGRPWELRRLAATMARSSGSVQAAFVVADLDGLPAALEQARSFTAGAGVFVASDAAPGSLAFLFPGQGSQRPGMLADLFVAFPRLQRLLRLDDGQYADAMFPPAAFGPDDRAAQLAAITDTRIAQPTLGIAGLAMHEVLTSLGLVPDLAAGHSYGELVALCVAGAFGQDDLLELSEIRARAILDAAGDDPGMMAAVAAGPDDLHGKLPDDVVIANHNAPAQTVIAGSTPAVRAALVRLAEYGYSGKPLPVACAFHSPLVASAAGTLARTLARHEIGTLAFPVWSNTEATAYPPNADAVRAVLAGQVAEPVRFVEQIEAMYEAGARVFVEAGPGRALTQLVGRILGRRPHTAVACDVPGENGLHRLLLAVAELAVAGVPVDLTALFADRTSPVPAAVPPRPQWVVDGRLVRTVDGVCLPGGLQISPTTPIAASAGSNSVPSGPVPSGPVPQADPREEIVTEFLRTSREMVAAQREVMLNYLGAAPTPIPEVPVPALPATGEAVPLPALTPTHAVTPTSRAGGAPIEHLPTGWEDRRGESGASGDPDLPRQVVPEARQSNTSRPGPAEILEAVLATISSRTGYPRDMLGPGLDLEADLSIDSIKRTEVIGELAERLELPGARGVLDESVVEQLARIKTIEGIVGWLGEHLGADSDAPAPADRPDDGTAMVGWPTRHLVEVGVIAEPPLEPAADLTERRFTIVDDGRGIAPELADLLEQAGATVRVVESERQVPAGTDGLVHLGALRPGENPMLPEAFGMLRAALLDGAGRLVVATGTAGAFGRAGDLAAEPINGAGLRGLVRTMALEFPDAQIHAVDIDVKDEARRIAGQIFNEACGVGSPPVVGYADGIRTALRVTAADPVADGVPELDGDSVVLLTGGARGITASVAIELARRTGCHVEMIGRTVPESLSDDPDLAQATDDPALRRLLIGRGVTTPAEVEAAVRRIQVQREIAATMVAVTEHAASVRYHSVDVRDAGAVGKIVGEIYERHGRLDGIVHGAGTLEDRLLRDKSPESFERVYGTKVDGARALATAISERTAPRFFAMFGSVSGVFGNRGQADYSAANDALATFAHAWNGRLARRVICVDWGPWAGGGMVSPELGREYARRGVGLIDRAEGVSCLLAELATADGPAQVVYMCGSVSHE